MRAVSERGAQFRLKLTKSLAVLAGDVCSSRVCSLRWFLSPSAGGGNGGGR